MASDGSISGYRCSHAWVVDSLLPNGPSITGHTIHEYPNSTTACIEGLGHLACLYIYQALVCWLSLIPAKISPETIHAYIDDKAEISRLSNPARIHPSAVQYQASFTSGF
jgi:hypothetical protein